MSQVPQVPQGGPGRPQQPSDETQPKGKTSEKFTRLIKEVESTDAEKQGKRRERPKLEEEPEVSEVEVTFAEQAQPPAAPLTSLYIPEYSSFSLTDDESLAGLNAPSPASYGDSIDYSDDESQPPAPSRAFAPSPTRSAEGEPESSSTVSESPAARRKKTAAAEGAEQTAAARKLKTKPEQAAVEAETVAKLPAAKKRAAAKRTPTTKVVPEGAQPAPKKAKAKPKAAAAKPADAEAEVTSAEVAKKRRTKGSAAPTRAEELGAPGASEQAARAKEKARKQQAAGAEATEAMAPGLPFLAQAAVHHVSTVPTAQGSKIQALSGRPLPVVESRAMTGVTAVGGATGTTLTRSAGIERVLAALKAAVLTLEQQTDKRTLTITLKGDPRLAGTALDGLKISVEEFAAAPKQYNITMESSPEAQALLSGAAADMADQLNRLGRERGWSVQRLDVQVGRPLFHRKEASDMRGGAGGGRGGKTS